MALKINTTVNTKDGLVVPSGSFLGFNTIIPDGKGEIHFNPLLYINEQARTDGKAAVATEENFAFVYTPTQSEWANLNPLSVNQFYQTFVESIVGVGKTDIIL